jgi:hypothetical protein
MRQFGFDADPYRRRPVWNPAVPDRVDGNGVVDMAQVDGDHQQARLVAACLFQQFLDAGQNFVCLVATLLSSVCGVSTRIDGVAIGADIRVSLRRAVPLYRHG